VRQTLQYGDVRSQIYDLSVLGIQRLSCLGKESSVGVVGWRNVLFGLLETLSDTLGSLGCVDHGVSDD